jgi:hypothetical protein
MLWYNIRYGLRMYLNCFLAALDLAFDHRHFVYIYLGNCIPDFIFMIVQLCVGINCRLSFSSVHHQTACVENREVTGKAQLQCNASNGLKGLSRTTDARTR